MIANKIEAFWQSKGSAVLYFDHAFFFFNNSISDAMYTSANGKRWILKAKEWSYVQLSFLDWPPMLEDADQWISNNEKEREKWYKKNVEVSNYK